MSASYSAAISQRAWATGPDGLIWSGSLAAWPAVISSGTPPGISPQHGVQPADGLVTGPGQITVPLGPHRQHTGVAVSGHFLPGRRPQRRHRHRQGVVGVVVAGVPGVQQPHPGSQLGLHIATRSPAATSCWASRFPSPRAPSTAQVRSGQACAQPASFPAWSGHARTRSVPSGSPAAPTATAVCEPLCGPVPIITAISTLHFHAIGPGQTVAGMPYTGPALGARPSSGPRHGKVRRGGRIDLKPGTRGPAGGSGASPVGPLGTLRQTATPSRKVPIRRLLARRALARRDRP